MEPVPVLVKVPPLTVELFRITTPPLKALIVPLVVPFVLVRVLSITSVPPLEASIRPRFVAPGLPGLMLREFPTPEVALMTPLASFVI